MEDKLLKDLLLGFVKIHILHHANREAVFGQDFHQELGRHGYELSYGTLYPIFHKLEEQGLLSSTREKVAGKIRRYYTITESGREVLEKARQQARELADELFDDDP